MSIATLASLCLIKCLYRNKFSLLVTRYHHLGNTITVVHYKSILRQIYE